MKDDLIADIWTLVIEHIPEKHRKDLAADFVNTLLDYGIKESVLQSLQGVDGYLDDAINYATDGEEIEEGDVSAHQQHRDDDDERGVPEFLILPETSLAVVPRPLHLRQFRADLVDVGADLHEFRMRK